MSHLFGEAFHSRLRAACAGFPREALDAPELKRAAVALALVDADDGSGETAFLLTRRASALRTHAGQWALPGGRCDPGETPEQTAQRELLEELGVAAADEEVLGVLDDYGTRSGYAITPVVLWLRQSVVPVPNPLEVASVHRVRLDRVCRTDAVAFLDIPESSRPVVRLSIGDNHIHAPTAALVYQLAELVLGRITRVADLEQPLFAWR